MKKQLLLLSSILSIGFTATVKAQTPTQFTDGFLTVFKVTSGSTLTNTGTAVVIEEYNTSEEHQTSPNYSVPIPSTGNNKLVVSGTASSSGGITRSENGRYLIIPGYDTLTGIVNSAFTDKATLRTLNGSGIVGNGISGSGMTTWLSGSNNLRGGTSDDGTNYWISGNGVGIQTSTNGVNITTVSSTSTNNRDVFIYNGQLYLTTGAGTKGIYKIGAGKPTTSGQTATLLFTPTNSDPYAFAISPDSSTIYYVASSSGGIYRSTFDGSVWTGGTQIFSGSNYTGLAVDWTGYAFNTSSANGARIYASNPSTILAANDNGTNTIAADTLRTEPVTSNNAFRQLAFSPAKQTVSIGANTPAAAIINPSSNNVVLYQFNLSAEEGNSTLKKVIITQNGTATLGSGNDIRNLRLIEDNNGNGIAEISELSSILSTASIIGSSIIFDTISLTNYINEGGSLNFLIVGDVSSSATPNNTFVPEISINKILNSVNYTTNVMNAGSSWVFVSNSGTSGDTLTIGTPPVPMLTDVIIPQYIEGNSSTNSTRLPFVYRVTLNNLTANATYRYYNQAVIFSDSPSSNGAGNCIYANAGSFTRSSSPGLNTPGAYGTFTTDSTGSYTGWFITEPTGNSRFTNGNHVFMRIMLNNGAGGTSIATRLTTTDSVTVLNLSTGAINGTGLMGSSMATPRNFVFAYDNVSGTGRPISGSYIENDSVANTTNNNYASFYDNYIDSVDGAYGFVIPNTNANGIQRIEQRDFLTAMLIGCAAIDSNGVWPSGANTVNPTGGTAPVVITTNDAALDPNGASAGGMITSNDTVCSGANMNILWLSGYTGSIIKWQYSADNFSSDINDTLNMTDSLAYMNLTQSTYYRAIIQNGTCPAANSSVAMVSVITPAAASLAAFTTPICSTGAPFTLTNGTPSGGTYSGTGVSAGAFDPTISGVGTFVVTYTIVDSICTSADTASVMVSLCTGIDEFSTGFISIYPNPTSNLVNISLQQADIKELNITLVDIQGRELYTETIKNANPNFNKQIGLDKFAKGVYYIKLSFIDSKFNSQAKTSKLVIQ